MTFNRWIILWDAFVVNCVWSMASKQWRWVSGLVLIRLSCLDRRVDRICLYWVLLDQKVLGAINLSLFRAQLQVRWMTCIEAEQRSVSDKSINTPCYISWGVCQSQCSIIQRLLELLGVPWHLSLNSPSSSHQPPSPSKSPVQGHQPKASVRRGSADLVPRII